jgi:hypothetical protein
MHPSPDLTKTAWSSAANKSAWAIIALGTVIRLRLYLVDRSLWSDEAKLALNLINRSFAGLWQPLDWQQGAPIGFLMMQKAVMSILGDGEYALRLIPLLTGVLSLILFYFLAQRLVTPGAGLIALAMMSFSKGLIYYSSEMKQYSTDVLVTILILLATAWCMELPNTVSTARRRGPRPALSLSNGYSEDPDRSAENPALRSTSEPASGSAILARTNLSVWSILSACLLWFSHPAVFIIAGTGIFLIAANRKTIPLTAIAAALIPAVSFAIDYIVVLRPLRHSTFLHEFWQQGGFLPRPIGFDSIGWMWETFFRAFRTPGGIKLPILTPLVFLIGVLALLIRKPRLAAMLLLPPLIALASAAAGEYPYLHRLILFVLPMLFLVTGVGLESIWNLIPGPRWLAVGACSAALLGGAVVAAIIWGFSPEPVEEIKPLLKYLQTHRRGEDGFYAYWGSEPALRYYASRYAIDPATVIVGQGKDKAGFAFDIQHIPNQTIWILISHSIADDQRDLLNVLDGTGKCTDAKSAPGAAIYRYDLRRR